MVIDELPACLHFLRSVDEMTTLMEHLRRSPSAAKSNTSGRTAAEATGRALKYVSPWYHENLLRSAAKSASAPGYHLRDAGGADTFPDGGPTVVYWPNLAWRLKPLPARF